MNKNRICIFSAQYLPHMGGVERYTFNLSKKLIENGNEVVVVTSNVQNLPEYEEMDGVLIYRLPCFDLLDGRYPVLKCDKKFWGIHKRLKKEQFDMVIVNTRFYIHSLYGMLFARKKKIKCITIEHGTSHLSVHNKMLDFIGGIYEHLLTRIGKILCKDYYGVSKACNEWLKHFKIKAKGVLYNSIDLNEIEEVSKMHLESYREKYNIPAEATVITFTGRLLKEKGLPQLLNVVEELLIKRKDIYLFIAGDGDMEREVHQRKSEHIIPLGRIDFEHIIALLNESNIFCLPSFSEGFSTSILEAAACKCYVLTTARGGAKELLITNDYGTVILNNEERRLYSALEEILDDLEKRKKAVELTYERLKTHFTWDIVAEQIEHICRGAKG